MMQMVKCFCPWSVLWTVTSAAHRGSEESLGALPSLYFHAPVLMPPELSSLSSSPLSLDSLGPFESSPRHWTCWTFPVKADVPISLAEILDVSSPWDLPFQPHRLLGGGSKGGSPTVNAQR